MSDIFESVANKYKNSPSVIVLFIAALAMLIVGINHFAEDTYSSYLGLKAIETMFDMNVQIFDWTYWTMSIAPQIASIVFFYMYLTNTDDKQYLAISLFAQAVDFFADTWYRSNGIMLSDLKVGLISSALTFAYFTIGSEVFLSVGAGLCLKLFPHASYSWKYFGNEIKKVRTAFKSVAATPQKNSPSWSPESEPDAPGRISEMLRQKQGKSNYKASHRPKWGG